MLLISVKKREKRHRKQKNSSISPTVNEVTLKIKLATRITTYKIPEILMVLHNRLNVTNLAVTFLTR